jgi:pimeloyl-ACP methyl ester carboxylesterase
MPLASRPEVERSHRATFSPGEPLAFTPDVLATITQPTLVVHGEGDRLIPIAAGEYFARHLPNVRFERFADTGHWLMIEQPQQFADLLREFMHESNR